MLTQAMKRFLDNRRLFSAEVVAVSIVERKQGSSQVQCFGFLAINVFRRLRSRPDEKIVANISAGLRSFSVFHLPNDCLWFDQPLSMKIG